MISKDSSNAFTDWLSSMKNKSSRLQYSNRWSIRLDYTKRNGKDLWLRAGDFVNISRIFIEICLNENRKKPKMKKETQTVSKEFEEALIIRARFDLITDFHNSNKPLIQITLK
jgi:hypothetical protein